MRDVMAACLCLRNGAAGVADGETCAGTTVAVRVGMAGDTDRVLDGVGVGAAGVGCSAVLIGTGGVDVAVSTGGIGVAVGASVVGVSACCPGVAVGVFAASTTTCKSTGGRAAIRPGIDDVACA